MGTADLENPFNSKLRLGLIIINPIKCTDISAEAETAGLEYPFNSKLRLGLIIINPIF